MSRIRVLVTGAGGLLGSHLVDALLERDYQVTGVDNLSIGSKDHLSDAMRSPNFRFVEADVCKSETFENFDRHDVIVHMAAYKIEAPGLFGVDILENNSLGTLVTLKLAVQWNCRFVFASTSDVYGKNPTLPFREEFDLTLGPSTASRWGYAASKIFDEHLCFAYARRFDLKTTVIRYFNTYGPRHDLTIKSGGPQALFLDALLSGKEMLVYGDGSQQRCFSYIDDTIEMTVRTIESELTIGEILNIGNPDSEISILELANLAYDVFDGSGRAPITFIAHDAALKTKKYEEVSRRIPDITKLSNLISYSPSVSNKEGLQKTLEWQRKLPKYSSGG